MRPLRGARGHARLRRVRARRKLALEKKTEEALAAYTEGLEQQPDVEAYLERATIRMARNDLFGAYDDFSASYELAPETNARAANGRGAVMSAKGRHDLSIQHFTRAIEIDPRFAIAWSNRGDAYAWLVQTDAAVENFSRAIDLDPSSSRPRTRSPCSSEGTRARGRATSTRRSPTTSARARSTRA